jgi:hypothetical protein
MHCGMKRGGQNEVAGADPVHMTSPADILLRLYSGGYSATLDIAKYFHMFPTIEAEHKYLGCLHPETGEMLCYSTLPMDSGNSPGASNCLGPFSFALSKKLFLLFKDTPIHNDYSTGFADHGYHPHLGIGQVIIGSDILPACIIWIYVDDLLIHGPTYEKCLMGLTQILELSMWLGFICQSAKTVPPCQCVKYCGFLYDTVDILSMCIPSEKLTRALSQLAYVTWSDTKPLSCIGLAIIVGNLQSLVPATPNNIGASFLCHAYNNLHATQDRLYTYPLAFYYEEITLSVLCLLDLSWWFKALQSSLEATVQTRNTAHLGVTWGNGCSSGTGGTFEWNHLTTGHYLPCVLGWEHGFQQFIIFPLTGVSYTSLLFYRQLNSL